ncbi:MAG TPA: dienelactone hydrolase family protein [Chloroflexota bacterium]|nr:dienelactone hydrolase family protein [Chloroflexota bacterium]
MNELQRYLADEMVEEYQAGRLTRRELLRRITLITGSVAMAEAFLAAARVTAEEPARGRAAAASARPAPQAGVTVSPDDPEIVAELVQFPGSGVTLQGYLARPRREGPHAAVLQIHENIGLTEHHNDVSRRLAKAGYVGLAIDLLSRHGGTAAFADPAEVTAALSQMPPEQLLDDLNAGVAFLQGLPYVRATSVGVMGFCFGGGLTWRLITLNRELRAAVPFYGPSPPLDAVPNIQAAVLGIYAGEDPRINAGIPDLERALQAAGKTFEFVIYPGAMHAFFNDTRPNYHPEAARDAWARTLDWFSRFLSA